MATTERNAMSQPTYEDLERKVTYLEVVVQQHEEQARATLRGYGMVVEQRESALAENRRLSAKLTRRSRSLVRALNRERAAEGKPPLDLS